MHMPPSYSELARELRQDLPPAQVITDALRRLAWGTDASFYRLVPQIVVTAHDEAELRTALAACRRHGAPCTLRAAGTSLSGQAISDSVLLRLGEGFREVTIAPDAATVRLGAAVVGAHANRLLAPHGRKIGPDPASIDAAHVGGIAANNASGMCCGTRDNSYHTLAALRVVLSDGAVLDTGDAASVAALRASHAGLLIGLATLARRVRGDEALAARIRHKYRMKNTTGYGLNALVDFEDPIDILAHLMIGSEGTLGAITHITYRTVPDHAHVATALVFFASLAAACEAVTRLAATPVAAVELMDRAALAAVESKPGMPAQIAALGADAAALLVETRAADAAGLAAQRAQIEAALAAGATVWPVEFTSDPALAAKYWKVRKGTFTSVGAVRATGSTVIIEDVAFPVARLAEATLDLQRLLHEHGYREAIIFGHALEGNLHFVFTQDFGNRAEVERYAGFMDALARLVVQGYDGALKAEHGTGRNMAPFVELEWGREALLVMQEIKRLFDPEGLLNPGVILNDDAQAHVRHLKPLPPADPIVDKCIECGFCEPKCPSTGLTLSPRQRITSWREIQRRQALGEDAAELEADYAYAGLATCAACGLCASACPVEIETGKLIKALRGAGAGDTARSVASWVGGHYGGVTAGVRAGLAVADAVHGVLGTAGMSALTGGVRKLSGGRVPRWSPLTPGAARFSARSDAAGERLVYFPSCAARAMGPARGDALTESLPDVTARVLRKAGWGLVYPEGMDALCCGQPLESKGLMDAADAKSAELEAALRAASEDGRLPIVFDTSPCAYRMKRWLEGRLAVLDVSEALERLVLPRVRITPRPETVALHPVCSVVKQGLSDTLARVARACANEVVQPAEVGCCGWAGDKGFTVPELNEHALRHLPRALPADCRRGYSTSRTCEIGLSERSGRPYRSIVTLVDACASSLKDPA
jgi:D-lactate dehydrogenase